WPPWPPGCSSPPDETSPLDETSHRARTRSRSARPSAGAPDTGAPDTGAPDTGMPDTGAPDTGAPDTGTPDTGMPDRGRKPGPGRPPRAGGSDGRERVGGNWGMSEGRQCSKCTNGEERTMVDRRVFGAPDEVSETDLVDQTTPVDYKEPDDPEVAVQDPPAET